MLLNSLGNCDKVIDMPRIETNVGGEKFVEYDFSFFRALERFIGPFSIKCISEPVDWPKWLPNQIVSDIWDISEFLEVMTRGNFPDVVDKVLNHENEIWTYIVSRNGTAPDYEGQSIRAFCQEIYERALVLWLEEIEDAIRTKVRKFDEEVNG